MSKFAALAADVATPYRVELLDPLTDEPIKDASGNPAYIDVFSTDSVQGRAFDATERKKVTEKAIKGRSADLPDQLEANFAKAAKLTKAWHLVDPATGTVLDVPCNADNALELYSEPGMSWLFSQVWVGATNPANFMKRSAKN